MWEANSYSAGCCERVSAGDELRIFLLQPSRTQGSEDIEAIGQASDGEKAIVIGSLPLFSVTPRAVM